MTSPLRIPHCFEIEQAVLGAMLLMSKETCSVVFSTLSNPQAFVAPKHGKIFDALRSLYKRGEPIDLITVGEELRRRGEMEDVGSMAYLAKLTSTVVSPAHIEAHVRKVAVYALRREVIVRTAELNEKAYNPEFEVFDLLDETTQKLFDLRSALMRRSFVPLEGALTAFAKKIAAAREAGEKGVTGVKTGFTQLDALTGGWQNTDLIIVAARPSMGKTALALNLARNAAGNGVPAGVFSLEMSLQQLVMRIWCSEAKVSAQSLRNGYLRNDEYGKLECVIPTLNLLPLYLDDTPAISPTELRAKATRLVEQHGVGLIIVDYLQLMIVPGMRDGREREIATISRSLKALAKDLDVPVIALSQLNRNVEARPGGKPMLSDLRESGAIEQDADLVLFVHRNKDADAPPEDRGRASIIIAKQRNGQTGEVPLAWSSEWTRFDNLETRIPEGAYAPPVGEPHF